MDKATLSKKSVLALERLAKKVGAKTVTPDGKKKNKTQLVNSIIIAERLGKKNPALKTKKAPAKTVGRKTLGAGPVIPKLKSFKVNNLASTTQGSHRVKITDMVSGENVIIPFTGKKVYGYMEAIEYLKSIGIKIIGLAEFNNGTVNLYTKDFTTRLKKK